MVETDGEGYLSIDYTGLIPVIVEALKEQENIITAQSLKISELESMLIKLDDKSIGTVIDKKQKASLTDNSSLTNTINAFLYQNKPNPFTINTEISFFIPQETQNAAIYIFDMQGALKKTIPVTTTGQGSVIIYASDLNAGMYFYSLIVNDKEVDTKKMILTK